MFWEVRRLQPPPLDADDDPKAEQSLTSWAAKGTFGAIPTSNGERWYALKNDLSQVPDSQDYLPYPRDDADEQLAAFRNQWIMKRHKRSVVPAPTHTPMPESQGTSEAKARLFSLYMRPWVLLDKDASEHVPTLARLGYLPREASERHVKRRRLHGKQTASWPPQTTEERN